MRSPAEIAFRLRQEASNLQLYLRPPRRVPRPARFPLPDPDRIAARLRGSAFEAQLMDIAERILARRIPLLGYEIRPQGEIRWRRDYVHDRETEAAYFRPIPYLDFARAGDHKVIWELNRHQHLVALAQAGLLSGRSDFFEEIFAQLNSWLAQNPACCGINWASALEVALRALSWIWIHHLAGDRVPSPLRSRWLLALYHHGCFLEHNLSVYFSPNTHLQGEALALHALGILFGVDRWRRRGAALMREMICDHVLADGAHFERSSFYHVYALDMFLFHAVLEPPDEAYVAALGRMARYLWALAGSGEMPFFGDDDGGRLFFPFGERRRFARGTLAACAAFTGDTPCHGDPRDLDEIAVWWLGDRAIAHSPAAPLTGVFPDGGLASLAGGAEIVAVANAFGRGSAGHSHANALHFTLRHAGQDVLIDPGTYTYISDPAWRDRFRGTAMHNTVRIDGKDQADQAGPFRWVNAPETEILDWRADPWCFDARCRYRGITHRRRIVVSGGAIWVIDDISGSGPHMLEQFWHFAGPVVREQENSFRLPGGMRLIVPRGPAIDLEEGREYGWRSPVFGQKLACPALRVRMDTELPCRMAAVFDSLGAGDSLQVKADRLVLGTREVRL